MTSRVSVTLVVCLIGAAVATIMLFRPASDPLADLTATESIPPADAPADTPANPQIVIEGFAFGGDLTVPAGSAVSVSNADGAPHSLTSTDGLFDTGVLDGGAAGTFSAPSAPGTYQVFCVVHPSMTATVTVS